MGERLSIARHFIGTRWLRRFKSRAQLLAWQDRQVTSLLARAAKVSPFYAGLPPRLEAFPIMEKAGYRTHFRELNPYGIPLQQAEAVALQAEQDRDFSLQLQDDLSVGLSSGTSGQRGVFLVSPRDRCRWAGMILARTLSSASLTQILTPWRAPLKIAFFLRADSRLYRTVASRRVEFRYFDLLRPLSVLQEELQGYRPDILIAPASVLAELARSPGLNIQPRQMISVAEVLDEKDAALIESRFGVQPANVYQATEGFIAVTCPAGNMHLNEEHLHVEREWLDESRTRFHPLITDFSRHAQFFIRYRLDDILQAADDDTPCPCGRVSQVIRSIEGRADEVLHFGGPVFPDAIRQALYSIPAALDLYRVEQHGTELRIMLRTDSPMIQAQVTTALHDLFTALKLPQPQLRLLPWSDQAPGEKQRRIRCITPYHPAA